MRAGLVILCICAEAFLAGCGGSASNESGTVGGSVNSAAAQQELRQIATQAQALIASQVAQTSTADAAARLGEAQTKIESLATQLDDVQTDNPDLAQARDKLHDGLHALANQVGQLQQSVESGNIQQAIEQLSSSTAVTEVQQAIQDVMNQSG